MRFSADGTRLYASGFGPTAVFDTANGALLDEIEGDGLLAVSPDDQFLLVREGRRAARIVDLADSTRSLLLEMPAAVVDGAFSPDGTHVATVAGDQAWVWSPGTGELEETLEGHLGIVRALAFRSTGELVTAGKDGALFTWELDDWTATFRDWIRDVEDLTVANDDHTLVYDLPDGSLVGVSADPDIWLERACSIPGRGLSQEEWQDVFSDRPYDPACQAESSAASE